MIIAIDGPSAAGKGTLAKRLAAHFDLAHLDSGSLYRAVALKMLRVGQDPADEDLALAAAQTLRPDELADPALREEATGKAASIVAAMAPVRRALLDFQRAFARTPPGGKSGAVIDGRDIGTVVCPDATVKLFVTASDEVRARRRSEELQGGGGIAIYARVLQDMRERDARDSQRSVAPLVAADDAIVLDTSDLDADAVFAAALEYINRKIG
ncbi:MAG: (d)CMP kinase [Rhodospirillaceae bacterium]|jgi:CMP/dCMP kinase|nr:(d)CMP kinase [Rhodospirillaceae bacterium]